MGELFVVPPIGCTDVAGAEWPDVSCFVHLLQLLDVVNDPFDVHSVSMITQEPGMGQIESARIFNDCVSNSGRATTFPRLSPSQLG